MCGRFLLKPLTVKDFWDCHPNSTYVKVVPAVGATHTPAKPRPKVLIIRHGNQKKVGLKPTRPGLLIIAREKQDLEEAVIFKQLPILF